MKKISILIFSLSLLLVLAACGGGDEAKGGDLAAKKEELSKLKTERKTLNDKIRALEQEIALLDTNAVKDLRMPVRIAPVVETTFEHFVRVQGQIEADKNVMVSPKMGGVVTKVLVEEGQNVKAGQLLATMDDAVMQRSLVELRIQLELADTVYRRQRNLWDQKIGSEIQLLQAKTQKESLEKRIATTQEQIDMMKIKSPISGVVDLVIAKQGEAVAPGFGAFNVVNLSELSFKASISESYIPYVRRGDMVSINFPSIGRTVETKISNVSQVINQANRTVTVEANLPASKEGLYKANMVGEISIRDVNNENAVVIPMGLIQTMGEEEFVFVAERREDGAFFSKRLKVETGISYEGKVQVLSGLSAGAKLITEGATGLSEGVELLFLDNEK